MGWCNNVFDTKNYNKLINIKKVSKYEKLFIFPLNIKTAFEVSEKVCITLENK